jgi:hypothetical protein
MQTHGLNKLKIGLFLSLMILALIFGIMDRCSSRPQKEKTRSREPVIGYLDVKSLRVVDSKNPIVFLRVLAPLW